MAFELPRSVGLLGVRRGDIGPNGAYFSTQGSSTYFDPTNAGVEVYDLGQVRIADTTDKDVAESILTRALEHPGLFEQDRERLTEALESAQRGKPFVDYFLADELPLPQAARQLGYGGIQVWENDDWASPSSVFVWDIQNVRRLSPEESAQVRAYFMNEQGIRMEISQGKDGFWLVDGKPVVVQTTRDEDGLTAHGANVPEDQLAELVESHKHVQVKNQLGETVQLSFDMDGETLVVKDTEDLRTETIATLRQHANAWQEAANRPPNVLTTNRLIVLDKHGRAFGRLYANGKTSLSLKLPDPDFEGVTLLSKTGAEYAMAELMKACPEEGPFVVCDFQEYAQEQCDESLELIGQIQAVGDAARMANLAENQRQFVEALREGTGLSLSAALQLQEQMRELAAQHCILARLSAHEGGLSSKEDHAICTIEASVKALFGDLPGVDGLTFHDDPHDRTIKIDLRGQPLWVPLDEKRVRELSDERFWEDFQMKKLYVTLLIEDTGNAAFVDTGRNEEVARIIQNAGDKIKSLPGLWGADFKLYDINGNRVGCMDVADKLPDGPLQDGAVRVVIETGNAAFENDAASEVARILRDAASTVRSGKDDFPLTDINGNVVGSYLYQAAPSLEQDGVIDMRKALAEGRVYLAEDGYSGIAEDEYRYVVTAPDFEPGYGQGEGEVWLVNAKGEVANGYEEPQIVRENQFDKLSGDQFKSLEDVVLGRVSFEEYERRMSGDAPELA
ncbi:hypothetical protein [Bordetella flabilis]|uniref:Uncharacterized protein n=1 Tax=Bordetella flabilis TaxID=463014 RepID=A0A193GNB9_9BORD|nr:hypothetical protein [Bordetella flabilis]ANN80864.1 hypothetical protein BAU07_26445 [Bordetella flabilis]